MPHKPKRLCKPVIVGAAIALCSWKGMSVGGMWQGGIERQESLHNIADVNFIVEIRQAQYGASSCLLYAKVELQVRDSLQAILSFLRARGSVSQVYTRSA